MTGAATLEPREVAHVQTKYRKIVTSIPVPELVSILEALREHEPVSLGGQPPVLWALAEGCCVYDRWATNGLTGPAACW